MPKALVIVESPAKAKTIKRYLGSDYSVEASVGHIRDIIQPKNVKTASVLRALLLQTKKKTNKRTVSGESKSKSYTK